MLARYLLRVIQLKLIEKIARELGLVGIPTGRLNPCNLIADVCGYFVTADKLVEAGVTVPGRAWSVEDLRLAAMDYVGLDLVSEVLAEEMHPDLSIEEYWRQKADRLLKFSESNPEYFKRSLDEISDNICQAQRRLNI